MKKTIRQLAKEKVEEIEDQRLIAQGQWLLDTFDLTVDDFEHEGLVIELGGVPHSAGLKIKDASGGWSSSIMSWEELHMFFVILDAGDRCTEKSLCNIVFSFGHSNGFEALQALVDAAGVEEVACALNEIAARTT